MTYSFLELLIFSWLDLVDIYGLDIISHNIKRVIETSKEINHGIKTKRYTFSIVSDIDVEKSCVLNAESKFLMNTFLFFLSSTNTLLNNHFEEVWTSTGCAL